MENLIESNPKITFGKPVIKGTRITVELILEKIADGESVEAIFRRSRIFRVSKFWLVSILPMFRNFMRHIRHSILLLICIRVIS